MKNEQAVFGICPYATVQKIFSGKWSILIICYLFEKSHRFGELHRRIPEITQTTLTKQLRFLEDYDIIHRKVFNEIPPKVEYSITDIGREILPVLNAFKNFGDKYIDYLKDHEKTYPCDQ